MSSKTVQLEEIHQQIMDRFAKDRYVTVEPSAESSSEKYEVTYNVTGLIQNNDKSIQESKNHTISISIPFGFPHFPPSCKPVTQTFHPDFDEAAICIGDFWTRDTSLPELIIRIGRMISGEIYSHDNTFNEEAAVWYKENNDQLPFEIVNFLPPEDPIHESPKNDTESGDIFEIDVLDDSDFESSLDFLDIEESSSFDEKEPVIPSSKPESPNLDDLRILIRQKRFHELDELFNSYPKDMSFDGKSTFDQQITSALTSAKKLQRQADEFEHTGNPKKAHETFQQVAAIVSDYPNIQESLKRTQELLELLGDWAPGQSERVLVDLIESEIEDHEKVLIEKELTFFNQKHKAKLRILPLIIAGAFAIVIGVFLFPLFTEKSQLKKAQQTLIDCQDLLSKNDFSGAERKCDKALDLATSYQLLFKKEEKQALEESIRQVILSEQMQQGLAGNVFYEGQYIHKNAYDTIISYSNFITRGDTFFSESKWNEAIASYKKGLKILPRTKDSDPSDIVRLKEQITLAEVNAFVDDGIRYITSEDWQNGTDSFKNALEVAETLPAEKRLSVKNTITPYLSHAEFIAYKNKADSYFANKNWEKSLILYNKAKYMASTLTFPDTSLTDSVNEKSARAELYSVIKNGKDAFAKGNWDMAIARYGAAINMLEENSTLLLKSNSASSQNKLARVMLQASIIRDKQAAAHKLKDKQFDDALSVLKSIKSTIYQSSFKDQSEFQTILEETQAAIKDVQSQKTFAELTSYLKDNYKDLFTQHYRNLESNFLKDPVVSFLKMIDDKFVFKLQCTEHGRGRPSIYVMHYIYNPRSKKWFFYPLVN